MCYYGNFSFQSLNTFNVSYHQNKVSELNKINSLGKFRFFEYINEKMKIKCMQKDK